MTLALLVRLAAVAAPPVEKWGLQRCVKYAVEHNISIRQDSLNARLARYALLQSKYAQLPSLNASSGYGRSFGRSINPTTNQFVDGSYNYLSATGSANLTLFNGYQLRNTIAKNDLALKASLADLDQLKDDISLNVATAFLSSLLAYEQIHIGENQVALTKAQLAQTRAFAEAGRLPELNVAQLESQLASDSSNLINAIANYTSSVLDIKVLLNLDLSAPFEIDLPNVEPNGMLQLEFLKPDDIFKTAHEHFGSVKGSEFRVASAEKGVKAARGALYPQLSVSGQVGTNWASNYQTYGFSNTLLGYQPIGFVSSSHDTVVQPVYRTIYNTIPFGQQLSDNFRQGLSVNLNIPILNGWQARYAVKQAEVNLESQRLSRYNSDLTLKQNVYKAHNNAVNSVHKYDAAKRADDAARRALEFARKRYDLGLTSTVDFLVTQNAAFTAASNLIIAKYDLVFKMKIIDYYLGKELKL